MYWSSNGGRKLSRKELSRQVDTDDARGTQGVAPLTKRVERNKSVGLGSNPSVSTNGFGGSGEQERAD
jgi:hypothetical protein